MQTSEYERLAEHEENYWWHVGRLDIIRRELARHVSPGAGDTCRILNVGCGTGGTVRMLQGFGRIENVDASADAIAFMREAGFERLHLVDDVMLPFPDDHFDVVGAFDVLEHIDDDHAAFKEWGRVLRPGGTIVLTVPAYPWLWSKHDEALQHRRRYTRSSLVDVGDASGLVRVKVSYAIVFSLPLIVAFRAIRRALGREGDAESSYVRVPRLVNSAFIKLLLAESRLHGVMRFPAGTSVLAVYRK